MAACQDKYADASVGNVTGSNAVNVFLGIGIAWSIAAIYHALHGEKFQVEPGKSVSIALFLFFFFSFSACYFCVYRLFQGNLEEIMLISNFETTCIYLIQP